MLESAMVNEHITKPFKVSLLCVYFCIKENRFFFCGFNESTRTNLYFHILCKYIIPTVLIGTIRPRSNMLCALHRNNKPSSWLSFLQSFVLISIFFLFSTFDSCSYKIYPQNDHSFIELQKWYNIQWNGIAKIKIHKCVNFKVK